MHDVLDTLPAASSGTIGSSLLSPPASWKVWRFVPKRVSFGLGWRTPGTPAPLPMCMHGWSDLKAHSQKSANGQAIFMCWVWNVSCSVGLGQGWRVQVLLMIRFDLFTFMGVGQHGKAWPLFISVLFLSFYFLIFVFIISSLRKHDGENDF